LWVDDEIELLKPHILFLEGKGYDITAVNNGTDAIEKFTEEFFDVIFLDENMPGMSGLETLNQIKSIQSNIPVVMITKSEEEDIMDEAIGSRIDDYLIKPLNPKQILLAVKKILDNKRLVSEKTNLDYQKEFRNISMAFGEHLDHEEWVDIYRKLVFWELEIDRSSDKSMLEVLNMQKEDANKNFTNFIREHYPKWISDPDYNRPLLSHNLMRKKVIPEIGEKPVFFLVIDNLRMDQWKIMEKFLADYFNLEEEEAYYSILPTTTAYARNAIFSGITFFLIKL
jgi:CheY-like chemotaxis protein